MNYDYEILSRWGHLYPGLQLSGQEMFSKVEEKLKARAIPFVEISRVKWKEGGYLSAEREYLRAKRSGYAVDICAAPFGSGFFFSSWLTEPIPKVGCITLGVIGFVWLFIVKKLLTSEVWYSTAFGTSSGVPILSYLKNWIIWGGQLGFVVFVLILASQSPPVEEFVRGIPGIGFLYDRFFRPATFYRIDTGIMFHEAVHGSLMEIIDEVSDEKGIPRLSETERRPIHRELSRLR